MMQIPWLKRFRTGAGASHVHVPSDVQSGSSPDAPSAQSDTPLSNTVRGERAKFIVSGARSLQSRVTSLLAAGLMLSVGAGMLAWYYTEALSRPAAAHPPKNTSLQEAAGEGVTLPSFGREASPGMTRSVVPMPGNPSMPQLAPAIASLLSSTGAQTGPGAARPLGPPLEPSLDRAPADLSPGNGERSRPVPRRHTLDRRLSGEVFVAAGSATASNVAAIGTGEEPVAAVPLGSGRTQVPEASPRGTALETLLRPSVLSATRAQVLPSERLLLPKGTFIDCTLETAIDSTLPGMTTCVTATDTFGADGDVVLLERGTRLIGETRGEVRQGGARVFVVWAEARTPSGVVVQLDSPGTDELGRSGLEGKVNRHFWQRFGAAALVSTIDGVAQSEIQSSSRGGTVVLDPTASEDVLTEILRGTDNIPPTIRVHNGARIQVLVARDIDFRPVYELEPR